MTFTCSQCGKAFAHASSLSRHKKVCGTTASRLPCPHCATTFGRASDLRRHVNQSCKGTKRPAEEELPETPPEKYRLVDYESSEEDEPLAQAGPSHSWRASTAPSSDTESEEDSTAAQAHPFGPSQEEYEEEPSAESSDESWHTAEEEEPWEGEEASTHTEDSSPLNLDALKKALPWAQYQGISEEAFSEATQQIGGNPLFNFEFLPVSSQQWLRRVQKTLYHTRLRQRRAPLDTDDMGVAIVRAMEDGTRQHLEKIGARDEDRVFLALTPNGFEHVYQTTEFTVGEFKAGSTRIETLMRKIAGKLNSNEAFHPDDGFQLDLTLLRPMGQGSGHGEWTW